MQITVHRVMYGKKDVPIDKREYKYQGRSAVGTRKEWIEFAKDTTTTSIEFVDHIEGTTDVINIDNMED